MTKKQAKKMFTDNIILADFLYSNDKPALRQLWNEFVDGLQRSGQITERQAATWSNPILKQNDR